MSRRDAVGDDVVWLDDETGNASDEQFADLAGDAKPPLRRRTRVALALVAVAVVAGAIAAGVTRRDSAPRAAPSTPAGSTSATSIPVALPQQPPREAIAAIRTEFPTAELTSFSAIRQPETDGVYRIYNLRAGRRLLIVTVSPPRPGDTEEVNRTPTSIEIAQRLGLSQVSIQLRVESGGAPSARDYAGIQNLVQDPRLLAVR